MHTIERLAGWAAGLAAGDVPPEVLDLARAQRDSVAAAVAASASDAATRRVQAASADPLYGALAASIALDFDDYVCFGHTGHSAVLVAQSMGAETGRGDADQLLAQVAAGEIAARLGGACLIGPLNGQLWSFIHAAAGAVATGRLLGLDAGRMEHALALALWQAPRPTVPGFMAPDSKLLTAAEPALIGRRAARLAEGGVTGPLDLLDHPHGFLRAFAFTPLPGLLGGLGEGWALRTLSVKPYPGCAYIDTTVDALLQLGPIDVAEVASVRVEAGLLTCGMDALSSEYQQAAGATPTPVTVTFSIPWNVAIVLLAGRLTPAEVDGSWLGEHARPLAALARRVRLTHDWALTARTAEAFSAVLPPAALRRDAGPAALLAGVRRARAEHPSIGLGPADLLGVTKLARGGSLRRGGRYWDDEALAAFRMTFPARVRVRLRGGRELVAEADIPRGGAGHPSAGPAVVAGEKAAAHGAPDPLGVRSGQPPTSGR